MGFVMNGLYTQRSRDIGAFAVCSTSSEDDRALGGVRDLPDLWRVWRIVLCTQLSSLDFFTQVLETALEYWLPRPGPLPFVANITVLQLLLRKSAR